jgi:deoxyribodipyrimidine photo-lyase
MDTAVVIFTRDLRLHDNPALHLAWCRARQVLPLFVADPGIAAPPNRARFLAESLAVLREELRARHADLVIRHGDPAAEAIKLARHFNAHAVFIAGDVSRYAARRRDQLTSECRRHRVDLIVTPGLTVVPPGDLTPAGGGGHYRVFTPYWRAWRAARWRPCYPAPDTIQIPAVSHAGRIPRPAMPAHPDSRPAENRPAASVSPAGATPIWPVAATTVAWPRPTPPGSARTCGSAACRRLSWRSPRATGQAASSSAASSRGVTSSTR